MLLQQPIPMLASQSMNEIRFELEFTLKQRIVHSFHSEGVVAPIIEPFIGIPTIAFTNIKHSINPMLTRL